MKLCIVTLAFPILIACTSATSAPQAASEAQQPTEPPAQIPVETIEARAARYLEGDFDSKDQAKADASYLPISLKICKASAPELGTRVLYVEQARVGSQPYRQRLYVLEPVDDTTARSRVFELVDAPSIVGACDESSPRTLAAKDAIERAGCVVEMHFADDAFVGHTPDARWNGTGFERDPKGKRCASDFQGATYASSEVKLDANGMLSWDRGWDDNGSQVWGATGGGYRFVRRSTLAEAPQ